MENAQRDVDAKKAELNASMSNFSRSGISQRSRIEADYYRALSRHAKASANICRKVASRCKDNGNGSAERMTKISVKSLEISKSIEGVSSGSGAQPSGE